MHTKFSVVSLVFLSWSTLCFAQTTHHGFAFDNYSGIYGVVANPANSVDSKYRIHVNVLSFNQLGVSQFGSLTNFEVETTPNGFNGLDFSQNNDEANRVKEGYSYGHTDVLLPSVSWNFHENFGIGLLLRSRTLYDYHNVNNTLLEGLNDGFEDREYTFQSSVLNNTAHSWGEVGLNLSAVLINSNYHFVKFGGTFKYFFGNRAVEVRGALQGSDNGTALSLTTDSENPFISLNTASNANGESDSKLFLNSVLDNFSGEGSGIGGDIGFVYEWRPRETNRVDVRSNSSAVNKYKLKVSASVLDIGTIAYKDVQQNTISLSGFEIVKNSYLPETGLIRTIQASPENFSPALGEADFLLPRSLNLNLDYIILNNNNYYININYIKGLTKSTDAFANSQMDLVTVTPRYETRKFSVYLPVNFDLEATGGISAGLGVRYGPVTIGAAALSSMFTDRKAHHLYFGLSVPLMKDLYR
ncbi:MAG: hypothetical protein Mars2KO_14940 [Maribacter sp.]